MDEPLHIYGHLGSQPVRSLVIFVILSKISYTFHLIHLHLNDQHSESFKQINPFKEIPAILHGSYPLWESAAIITYLSEVFNTDNQWYPKDLKIRAKINAYLHWHHENTRELIAGYVREKYVFPKFFGADQISEEKEKELKGKFEGFFLSLKEIIAETGFVARTAEASIADIFAYSEIAQSWLIGYDLSGFSEVWRWFRAIGENEVVKEVHDELRRLVKELGDVEVSPNLF